MGGFGRGGPSAARHPAANTLEISRPAIMPGPVAGLPICRRAKAAERVRHRDGIPDERNAGTAPAHRLRA